MEMAVRNLSIPFIWLSCFVGLQSASATAPPTTEKPIVVAVGDGTVDASRLKEYDNAFLASQRTSDGRTIVPGIWTDQLRLRDVKGRKLWVRTQTLGYFDGRITSSVNMFDPNTFAPVSNIVWNADGSREAWTFTATAAEGHIRDSNAHETTMIVPVKAQSFDMNCCMRSLLPAALPLGPGKSFQLPIVPAQGDPETIIEHVRGRERVEAGYLGTVDAWVVETAVPGGGIASFWIADAPPYLVRMKLVGVPAKPGVTYDQFFDMLGKGSGGRTRART